MYKYEIIAQDIQSKILSGFYKPDEKLPQELELCKQYDASRITIREAMEHLVHNGLITKRRGSGTFVKAISGGALNQEGFARSQQFGGFAKDKPGHEITSVIHVKGSIYSYIENTLKLKIQSGHRIARASMPTDKERDWLDIGDAPIPILEVEQVAYLGDGRIFEYSKSRHRADCFELRTVSVQ